MGKLRLSSKVLADIAQDCAAIRVTLDVEKEIGDGGEGLVYGGTIGDHQERIAAKVHLSTLDGFEQTFEHSKTPGCVRLLNYLKNPGGYNWPVTIWERGEKSLRDVLKASPGGLPRERCLELLKPVARTLQTLHGQRVFHGDVKPDNLLVFRVHQGEQVKVGDLGLAQAQLGKTTLVHAGHGSKSYLRYGDQVNEKLTTDQDLFAFAVTYGELRLGRHPYGDEKDLPANLRDNRFDLTGLDEDEIELLIPVFEGTETHDRIADWLDALPSTQPSYLHDERLRDLRRKARGGDLHAMHDLAWALDGANSDAMHREEAQAARWYWQAAERDHAPSIFRLAEMIREGRGGVPRNFQEAAKWYRRGAENDDVPSMRMYAYFLELGRGVVRNELEAAEWYRRAAERDDGFACWRLGLLLERGSEGLPHSHGEALACYRKGAQLGHPKAAEELKRLEDRLRQSDEIVRYQAQLEAALAEAKAAQAQAQAAREELERAKSEATQRPSARSREPKGPGSKTTTTARPRSTKSPPPTSSGTESASRDGTKPRVGRPLAGTFVAVLGLALILIFQFYEQPVIESPDSLFERAEDLRSGGRVKQDASEAVALHRKAAELGNADAMNNLAVMLSNGEGAPKNDAEAFTWFRKAAELGNPTAMSNLAEMYRHGRGVGHSIEAAKEWYGRAITAGNTRAQEQLDLLIQKEQPKPSPPAADESTDDVFGEPDSADSDDPFGD